MTKREAIYLSCLIPSMLVPYEHYPLRHTDYEYEYRNSHIFPRSGLFVRTYSSEIKSRDAPESINEIVPVSLLVGVFIISRSSGILELVILFISDSNLG